MVRWIKVFLFVTLMLITGDKAKDSSNDGKSTTPSHLNITKNAAASASTGQTNESSSNSPTTSASNKNITTTPSPLKDKESLINSSTTSASNKNHTPTPSPLKEKVMFFSLGVGCTVFIASVVFIIVIGKKTKRNTVQIKGNATDCDDAVPYASVNFTKKTNHKAQTRDEDGGEDDSVTYSTVKVSSCSPAGASSDSNVLYQTVTKPKQQDETR